MISLNDKINHMMAHGIKIQWLQDVDEKQDKRGANGSKAAKTMLLRLKQLNKYTHKKTVYCYLKLWSDSFLKSWVSQKGNSIWILTVTLPNFDGNASSAFHTHCLAIGRASEDHTAVIDYYLSEIESMRSGVLRYSSIHGEIINTCFDLLVYAADRPERSAILKSRHLGTYGKRALWSGVVDADKLSYCRRCYEDACCRVLDKDTTSAARVCNSCC